MGRLQIRVVMISAAVAALVFVAVVLGFVAERANSKSFVGFDGTYCLYRRTAALGCGIAAALFLLASQALLAAASGCFGRCGEARARPISGRTRTFVVSMAGIFWTLAVAATGVFVYGASRNVGSARLPTRGRYYSKRGCHMLLGRGAFSTAAVMSAFAFVVGIIAYVYQEMADPEEPQGGVAMGQQPNFQPQQQAYQQQQEYPAMGYPYPAAAPPPPYGGYGAKAPAGPAVY